MAWNWQLPNWPHFSYDSSEVAFLEKNFLKGAGGSFAILKHLGEKAKKEFIVEVLCNEGLSSSEIEGEILNRVSLQSSIQRHFGLLDNVQKLPLKELGVGDLMWKVYDTFDKPLTHEMLGEWHRLLMQGELKIADVGKYRTHDDPMQIVSGRFDKCEVYFEAPASSSVYKEMTVFIDWFNQSDESSILAKAAVAHIYFESIHPFEDGNGRIGRALVEKILSRDLGYPTLIAVSQVIARRKKDYYKALAACNRTLDIRAWVHFFSEVILESQEESIAWIHFLVEKSQMMHRLEGKINSRQKKVLLRLFSEGIKGFKGGLSAKNYTTITKASPATATRDLTDLVEKSALYKTGQLRHTRYWLNVKNL